MGEVFEFTVNGQVQRTEEDKPLLRYLRDESEAVFRKRWLQRGCLWYLYDRGRWQGDQVLCADHKKSCWKKYSDSGGFK